MTRGPVALLLAAGDSSRLGRPKQFLRRNGATLLHSRLRRARQATGRAPLVVTGARRFAVALVARRAGARVVHNPRWRSGMGGSLAVGVGRLTREPAVLVMTVDQYAIDTADLVRLVSTWRRRPWRAVAAGYAGRRGIPAVLPRRWFARLRRLRGDRGARNLLDTAQHQVTAVRLDHARHDVDLPGDWPARPRRSTGGG